MDDIATMRSPEPGRPAPRMVWVRPCPICRGEITKGRAWDEWACHRCGWHGA